MLAGTGQRCSGLARESRPDPKAKGRLGGRPGSGQVGTRKLTEEVDPESRGWLWALPGRKWVRPWGRGAALGAEAGEGQRASSVPGGVVTSEGTALEGLRRALCLLAVTGVLTCECA